MTASKTSALHAYLTNEALDSWRYYADENGVSVTGLLEAVATDIASEIAEAGDATLVHQNWVREARRVDASRRRRTPV